MRLSGSALFGRAIYVGKPTLTIVTEVCRQSGAMYIVLISAGSHPQRRSIRAGQPARSRGIAEA
jgi:hypothetical protein